MFGALLLRIVIRTEFHIEAPQIFAPHLQRSWQPWKVSTCFQPRRMCGYPWMNWHTLLEVQEENLTMYPVGQKQISLDIFQLSVDTIRSGCQFSRKTLLPDYDKFPLTCSKLTQWPMFYQNRPTNILVIQPLNITLLELECHLNNF